MAKGEKEDGADGAFAVEGEGVAGVVP